ncbi:sulfotransferase family protein [Rhizorhabdus histidinilytica]
MSIRGSRHERAGPARARSNARGFGRTHRPVRLRRSWLPRGLDRLLSDIRALDLPEAFAQATAFRIGQFLDARAMAVDGLRRHGEVRSTPIRQPLIIAGLVRSGTTALHQLLSLDPQFQGPEHWLTVAPMPRPPRDRWQDIPQYRAVADAIAAFVASAPEMLDDHMMSAEGIEESLFILATGFASNMWPSMWPVPRYDLWYRDRDDSDSYRWLADVLRLIGKGDDRRWLLKNPTDLFSLGEVLNVFPDAMIVQTHRDPVEAMPSICNLILAAQRVLRAIAPIPWRSASARRRCGRWRSTAPSGCAPAAAIASSISSSAISPATSSAPSSGFTIISA